MAPKKKPYDELAKLSYSYHLWQSVYELLGWDQETCMPEEAADLRATQSSLLAAYTHRLKTAHKFGKVLNSLIHLETGEILDPSLSLAQQGALKAWRREYLKNIKLPKSFVKTFSTMHAKTPHVWQAAKTNTDFKAFSPYLEKMVQLNRKKADYLGFRDHPYDALLDFYEPDTTVAKLEPLFDSLKNEIKPLFQQILAKPRSHPAFLNQFFDPTLQLEIGKELLHRMGLTNKNSRLDLSSHPFCMPIHPRDVRMTTRIDNDNPIPSIFSVLHEGGHGLYCQGLPLDSYGTPLSASASLSIDESQSRFWETIIGRSRPFWHDFLPKLQQKFPSLQTVSLDQCYAIINTVTPSFIRVDADEVTYTFHIILRFEIEKLLIEGTLKVKDVPQVWNQKMEELLGITPPNDALGCLQDIHWALGAFGYFPTYTLGNLYAAQFFEAFSLAFPDWEKQLAEGNLDFIREWLKTNIHQLGMQLTPDDLVKHVTGKPLSATPYLNHIKKRFL